MEKYDLEEKYDENIENSKELAENQLKKRINELEKKSIGTLEYHTGSIALFGGRVVFKKYSQASLSIDGIYINKPLSNDEFTATSDFYETAELLGYINIISKIGVDSFFENYKKETELLIEKLEKKLKSLEELYRLEGTIEKNANTLTKYWRDIKTFHIHGFILGLWMMPGIENETASIAYDKLQVIIASI
ncbi:hypothetical protein ACPUEN_11760 [Algoriphagus yeomjeoni]|uniref:hypothetical protein n=1 Tax=Algoriphagus yeomjeoni TaxID=291403 RepID=UPI003CE5AAD3